MGGKLCQLPLEVVLLLIVGQAGRVRGEARVGEGGGGQAAVELLDRYELDQELIRVLERPVPIVDLFDYIQERGGYVPEDHARVSLCRQVHHSHPHSESFL